MPLRALFKEAFQSVFLLAITAGSMALCLGAALILIRVAR